MERLKATDAPIWRSKEGEIKIEDMNRKYLQNALNYAQEREYYFSNRSLVFSQKIDELLEEAERRKIVLKLKDNNQFFINTRKKPIKTLIK